MKIDNFSVDFKKGLCELNQNHHHPILFVCDFLQFFSYQCTKIVII